MVLVAAVFFLIASAVFGRGEELAPLPPGASPTRLPVDGASGDGVRSVRFQQVFRGYKMSEVDWVLSRLGDEVDQLRARLAELEVPVTAGSAPAPAAAPAVGTEPDTADDNG